MRRMLRLLLITTCLVACVPCVSQEAYFPYTVNNRVGFRNREGKVVISPLFEDAQHFSEGLAAVKDGGVWGYIDKLGHRVIPFKFMDATPFHSGLAAIMVNNGYGYIDKRGELKIAPTFTQALPFADGLAAVKTPQEWLFINRDGTTVLRGYSRAQSFSRGLAAVRQDDKWQFITKEGKAVKLGEYKRAISITDGIAVVQNDQNKITLLAQDGKQVGHKSFDASRGFSEDIAAVSMGEEWGYIRLDGEWLVPPGLWRADSFQDGLARIVDCFGRNYYINKDGHISFEASDKLGLPGVAGSELIEVSLKSSPAAARVYMIPLRAWEADNNISNDEKKLALYDVGNPTDTNTKVIEKKYMALFKLRALKKNILLDVRPDAQNAAFISLSE